MKKIIFYISLLLAICNSSFSQSIIPTPVKLQQGTGSFTLSGSTVIGLSPNKTETFKSASYLADRIRPATGFSLIIIEGGQANIVLSINARANPQLGEEGYTLQVTNTMVTIAANTASGLFYGIQTFLQLLPVQIESSTLQPGITWSAPSVSIIDYPRFAWRGVMLDVSRHFFPKEYVKSYIDRMARYKFNRFHWHLTDDEGWRIEIKSLPKLTGTGAYRVPRDGEYGNARPPQPGEKATDGGFYTQEDIKEVVQYAKDRFIEILPEVDVPGHSMAAIASYPELSVTKNPNITVDPGSKFSNWFGNGKFEMTIDNTLNPIDENVYKFLDKVFTEVAQLFPFEYIHMGGDECYKGYWMKDASIQAFMNKNNLKDGEELQAYFNKRLNAIVSNKKKKLIGWDEILEGGIAPGAAVMSWRGIKGGIEATKLKHPVVMSPSPMYYLDMMQGDPAVEARVYGRARLKDVYDFDILAPEIDSVYVLGGQGNLWTEQVSTPGKAEYMTWPRSFALSESLWSPRSRKNWTEFVGRVENHFKRFEQAIVNYAPSIYDPAILVSKNSDNRLVVELVTEIEGLDIFYTIDNSVPDKYFSKYAGPVKLSQEVKNFRLVTYRNGTKTGRIISLTREELEKRIK